MARLPKPCLLGEPFVSGGREPATILIGGTLPVTEILTRVLKIDTVYFSFSTAGEDFHSPNEFFRLSSFRNGMRAWMAYWAEAGAVKAIAP